MTLYQSKNVPHESYEHHVLLVCQLNEEEKRRVLLGNLCRYIKKVKGELK